MNGTQKKVFKWVTGTHGLVLLLLLVVPWFGGCFHKKPEIIATFDLGAPPPPPPATIKPESVPEPKPVPELKPEPVKKIAPLKKVETNAPPKKVEPKKPAATNAPPKKVETNAPPKKAETKKPAVTNAPVAKPKTMEERLAEVRAGGKPVPSKPAAKPAPALDFSGLKSAMNSTTYSSGSTYGSGSGSGGGVYSPFAGYYESIKRQMYTVWQQPASVPVGLTATATIRVERDGTVSSKALTRRSGNMLFDQSVQNALSDTSRLPVPPADLPSRTIEIEFALSD